MAWGSGSSIVFRSQEWLLSAAKGTSSLSADGAEFGFGAEIGISTDKLHARGPMALEELCSYKYLAFGTGQVK